MIREERAVAVRKAIAETAEEAARDADPADVSRHVAPADRRRAGQLGRRGEGEFLSRARELEEDSRNGAMTHLTPDELIDAVGGHARGAIARRTSTTCEHCQRELAELSSVLAEAKQVSVPEPSPLFWQHFSERVRTAIDAEAIAPAATGRRGCDGRCCCRLARSR